MSLIRKDKKGLIWKVRKIKNTKKQNRFDKLLEMPKEISSTDPKVTIMGFNEMLIENYKGILEYQEFFVRISTHIGIVNVNGFNLVLNEMSSEDVMITGKIESVDFESTE